MLLVSTCLMRAASVFTQTTAFTYQGKLTDTNVASPTNGTYEMQFKAFDAASLTFGICLLLLLVCAANVSAQIATGGQFRLEQAAVAGGGVQSASGGQFSVQEIGRAHV